MPEPPEIPDFAEYLVQWFNALSSHRSNGPEPLLWSEVQAWMQVTGECPSPQEVGVLMAMDEAFCQGVYTERKEGFEKEGPPEETPPVTTPKPKPMRRGRK